MIRLFTVIENHVAPYILRYMDPLLNLPGGICAIYFHLKVVGEVVA